MCNIYITLKGDYTTINQTTLIKIFIKKEENGKIKRPYIIIHKQTKNKTSAKKMTKK